MDETDTHYRNALDSFHRLGDMRNAFRTSWKGFPGCTFPACDQSSA